MYVLLKCFYRASDQASYFAENGKCFVNVCIYTFMHACVYVCTIGGT